MPGGYDISPGFIETIFRGRCLTVDAASNSTATGVEITGLRIPNVGPGVYLAEYVIVYSNGATTTGAKFGINHTGTAPTFAATLSLATTGTSAVSALHDQATTTTPTIMGSLATRTMSTTSPNLGPWTDIDTQDASMQIQIVVSLVVTAIGDLALWHASETTAASTVKTGSIARLTKFA